jgi:hypothetical protein
MVPTFPWVKCAESLDKVRLDPESIPEVTRGSDNGQLCLKIPEITKRSQ